MRDLLKLNAFFALILFFLPNIAWAYVGPGAGLTAIGSLIALIFAVIVAIAGFVWYPMKRLMKGNSTVDEEDEFETIEKKDAGENNNQ